ncbi:MAG: DUF1579 domain-containing protein [Nitrosomonas sp.]|nr:MAG: DUF1579 domain-containing protein [Nitrosomonas sp.]
MRQIQFILAVFCTSLIVISVAVATEKTADKPVDPQALMEIYTKLATPGEPHKLLASLTGSWTTQTKEWMHPQEPFMQSTGFAEITMLLDGRFLQQRITGSMHGKPFSAIWTVVYDNLLQRYISTWIDTMSTQIFTMEGTAGADGKTITFTGQHAEIGGGQMTHRAIWKIVDGNLQEFVMYGAHHGGQEVKMLETIYVRK